MAGVLTEDEKAKTRHHLGYLGVQEASTFVLGLPAGIQTSFQIEGAMNRVMDAAMPNLRRHLQILDQIEEQMVGDLELLAVKRVDTIEIREDEQEQLVSRYLYWRLGMANILGIAPNPFDKRFMNSGMNLSVNH